MKIDRMELYHVAIPLQKPFYPAWIPGYPQTENRFTLIRLTTDDGVEGISAGVAFEYERQGLGGLLGPYIIGLDPSDIDTARQRLREASYLGWRNYWIEAAFWDILGKVKGKPVWELLGGKEISEVDVYASTGEIHPAEERIEEVLKLREMGFSTIKLRVHSFELKEDLAVISTVRDAIGSNIAISVDANQGWRVALIDDAPLWSLERAIDFAKECTNMDVSWIEEPLDMCAYSELAELCSISDVPIAGGELNGGWHEFKIMFEKGSYDIYQPDATMGGGISDAITVLNACEERGLGFAPHTWTNGLGFIINLHVYASGPRNIPIEYPYEPPGWIPEVRDGILKEPIRVSKNGTVPVPNKPGLGIEIDDEKLSKYGKKYFEMTSRGLAIKTIRDKGLFTALRLAKKKGKKP